MDPQCAREYTPAMRRRFRRAVFWHKLRFEIYLLIIGGGRYGIYARWLHRRGKHIWRKLPLIDGDPFVTRERCEWCGNIRETHDLKARFDAARSNEKVTDANGKA